MAAEKQKDAPTERRYLVLGNIVFTGPNGRAEATEGDVVVLGAEDAASLVAADAVEAEVP